MNLLNLLIQNPIIGLAIVAALVFTLSVHEFSHAWVGYLLGDRTAERAGRLTINPLAHLDPFGFLMILFVGIGYAKPVPFNPYNLQDRRWGPALIAVAGPLSNLVFGSLSAIAYGLLFAPLGPENLLIIVLWYLSHINFALMLFNLIPLPPLDGSKALLAVLDGPKYANIRNLLETQGPMILIGLILLDAVLRIGVFSWIFTFSNVLFSWLSGVS